MPAHALILTAPSAAGRDLSAEVLADTLRERGATADVVDGPEACGPVARAIGARASLTQTRAAGAARDAAFVLGARVPPLRSAGLALAERALGSRLDGYLRAHPAAVVVSTHAMTTQLLGRMRLAGSLRTPVVSAITDLAALRPWVHPSVDLHLITHPESKAEVLGLAGPRARVEAVHGLTDLRFTTAPERLAARAELELPARGALVVVSGGSRGVGDLATAIETALHYGAQRLIALTGHNAALREQLQGAYGDDERVQVWGFTDRMVTLLAAADVVIHSTAGLTPLEALMCDCRVISFGWPRAHIRANDRVYAELGIVAVATSRRRLAHAIVEAIATPRIGPQVPDLPVAADLVLALAEREPAHAG